MNDNEPGGGPPLGRTRWRRFGVAFAPPMIVLSVVVGLMSTGAIALPIQISGVRFKLEADSLVGQGFRQYGSIVPAEQGSSPVAMAVTELDEAELTNMTQTVCLNAPVAPGVTLHAQMVVKADAEADNLVVEATALEGTATFNNFQIGEATPDAVQIDQTADSVTIENLNQTTLFTSASMFKLKDLKLSVDFVGSCPSL